MAVPPTFAWPRGSAGSSRASSAKLPSHTWYGEPAGEGLGVLLSKPPSPLEIINDLDGCLMTFYRCVRFHKEEPLRELEWVLNAREEFESAAAQQGMADIERAVVPAH